MKIEITYPVITFEHHEIEIEENEAEKIQNMSKSECGAWAYHRLEEEDTTLPTWKYPAGYELTKSAFTEGLGRIDFKEAQHDKKTRNRI